MFAPTWFTISWDIFSSKLFLLFTYPRFAPWTLTSYVGLYLISLVIGGWLSGWFWSLVSLVINIAIIVIFALPTDHLKESNELIDEW